MQLRPSRRLRFCFTTLLSLLAVLPLAQPTLAQDETLITGPIQSGGFGGPVIKATEVDGAFRVIVGGRERGSSTEQLLSEAVRTGW